MATYGTKIQTLIEKQFYPKSTNDLATRTHK